jgi:hypothetical protein
MNALDAHGDGDASSPPLAPLAPVVERSSLVLWLGDGQGAMLDGLDRSVVGAVAASLSQAARNVSALRRARRELGLGQIFDLECWRLQLDVGHPLRGAAWEALGMDSGRVYRPDTHTVSGKTARAQAQRVMDAQRPRGDLTIVNSGVDPSIFTTPAHWLPDRQAGHGRRNDLALAEACVEIFDQLQLAAAPIDHPDQRERQLYAALMVDAGRLEHGDIDWIVDAYSHLEGVDGYIVWAVRFNESLVQARRHRELMDGLQERSGRPVIGGGLWHFHTAALSRGLAATCIGPGRLKYPPLPPEEPAADGKKSRRGGIFVYHGAILGCFGLGEAGEARMRRAFIRHGCACGAHPANEPPKTNEQKVAHNRFWLMHEAREALAGAGAATRLAARVPRAREARAELGMGRLAPCWSDLSAPGRSAATG